MRPAPLLFCLLLSAPVMASVTLKDAPLHLNLLNVEQTEPYKTGLSFKDTLKLYGAGAATAVVTVPGSLLLGMALSGLSNNLYVSLVPALFSWVLIPPIAITLVEYFYGRSMVARSTRLLPGMLIGIAVNLVIVVLSALVIGVDAGNLLHVVALTGFSAAVLPAVITMFIKKPYDPLTPQAQWREQMQLQRPQFAITGKLMEVPL